MTSLRSRFRRPSFAGVTSLLALFVALGGTSYAVSLPGNSVGKRQIRTAAVGKSEARQGAIGKSEIRTSAVGKSEIAANGVGAAEVRRGAIDTTELRDAGVKLDDLDPVARTALTETAAVTFRAAVTSQGAAAAGNVKGASRAGPGEYVVDLGRDVSGCQLAATLAAVKSGNTVEPARAGLITAAADAGANTVHVSIKDADAAPLDAPFHLLVAC